MGLLERIKAARPRPVRGLTIKDDEQRFSIDSWISDFLIPAFNYGGTNYPLGLTQTLAGNRAVEIAGTLPSYIAALNRCPPAFAAELVRSLVLSQARFTFRNPPWHPRTPRRTFGTADLGLLERPWPNGTTGELISRAEWHAGLAGNAFVARRPDRLRVLRPDWTAILYGSDTEIDNPGHALDGRLIGYIYWNGGPDNPYGYKPEVLFPNDVAHWAPIPDPLNAGVGMSWLTPAIRDIQGDQLASEYKIRFFENGATPNLVVKGISAVTKEQFDQVVDMLEERHAGAGNAYKTLYLTGGADATVIGSNLKDIDFKAITSAGETRLSVLSRVPASLLGISEGLAGSTLNAGNFSSARRSFADTWVYPSLQDLAASLAPLINVPDDAELWFDVADIPLLREDAKDAAEIAQIKAIAIRQLIESGCEPLTAIATVAPEWAGSLKHTNLVSVQLMPPGTVAAPKIAPTVITPAPKPPALPAPKARDQEETE